jgi:hypothetical protein
LKGGALVGTERQPLSPLTNLERKERLAILESHPNGLTLAATSINRLAGHHGLHGGEARIESERYIGRDEAIEASEKIVKKIRRAAENQLLLTAPRPIRLIFIWRWMAGVTEVRQWIEKELRRDESVIRFAQILPSTSYRTTDDGRSEVRTFKAATYAEILDVNHFKERLASIATSNPGSREISAIQSDFLAAEVLGLSDRF